MKRGLIVIAFILLIAACATGLRPADSVYVEINAAEDVEWRALISRTTTYGTIEFEAIDGVGPDEMRFDNVQHIRANLVQIDGGAAYLLMQGGRTEVRGSYDERRARTRSVHWWAFPPEHIEYEAGSWVMGK